MNYDNSLQAWKRREELYRKSFRVPKITMKRGEIYEIDFGINLGDEFSGRHLAVVVRDSNATDSVVRVAPISSRVERYGLETVNFITKTGETFEMGLATDETRNVSKIRLFRKSLILNDYNEDSYCKGEIKEDELSKI